MSTIVEQVRDGLGAKISGIQNALMYVNDPRERERLKKDCEGAEAALKKLNEEDTRSPEELEKIASMVNDVEVEAPDNVWGSMSPVEKFKYQVELYCGKLDEAYKTAFAQHSTLDAVCKYLKKTDFVKHPYMRGIYNQFKNSLKELSFSLVSLKNQNAIRQSALDAIDDAFPAIDTLNRFLNNPMSLPHILEEREALLEGLKDGKK